MAVENDDKAVAPEVMELESDDSMTNVEPSSDNSSDQRKMESGVDEEEIDKLVDGTTNALIKEEDEYLRGNSDITEGVLIKNNPTKDTDFSVGQLRKKPDFVIVGPNHKFIVRSRYRSTSLGSCHDLCKYGHKHEPEKKTKRLTMRTIREGQPLMKTGSADLEKVVQEKVAKKKEFNRRLSLPGLIPEKAPLMHMEDNNLPKKDIYRSKMERIQSEIMPSAVPSPITSSRSKTVKKKVTQSSNFQKSSTQKVKEIKTLTEVGSYSKGEKEVKAKEPICGSPGTSLKKEAGNSKGEKEIKAKGPMSNAQKTPLKKSPGLRARLFKDRKSTYRSKIQINPEVARIDGHDDIPEITVCMIEPNANINLHCSPRATRASKTQGSKGNRKGNRFSLLSSSSRESSRLQGEDHQGSEATKNKQIGVKSEDGGSKTRAPRAKSTVSCRIQISDNSSRAKSTVDPKLKSIRKEKSCLEEKDASAWKLKFKRGTVVALQAANNSPKKLRFKRVKTLGEDQNVKAEVDRNLKNEYDMGNKPHDTNLGPEKVRLRHQEASEKKDDVDLNNVIEETASKLVKTRKSKVKALVGAFETVMSLRDHKRMVEPSAS